MAILSTQAHHVDAILTDMVSLASETGDIELITEGIASIASTDPTYSGDKPDYIAIGALTLSGIQALKMTQPDAMRIIRLSETMLNNDDIKGLAAFAHEHNEVIKTFSSFENGRPIAEEATIYVRNAFFDIIVLAVEAQLEIERTQYNVLRSRICG